MFVHQPVDMDVRNPDQMKQEKVVKVT